MSMIEATGIWYLLLWAFALGVLVGLMVPWLLRPVLPEAVVSSVRHARELNRLASSVGSDDDGWLARWLEGEEIVAAPAPRPSLKLHRGGKDGAER